MSKLTIFSCQNYCTDEKKRVSETEYLKTDLSRSTFNFAIDDVPMVMTHTSVDKKYIPVFPYDPTMQPFRDESEDEEYEEDESYTLYSKGRNGSGITLSEEDLLGLKWTLNRFVSQERLNEEIDIEIPEALKAHINEYSQKQEMKVHRNWGDSSPSP